MNEQTQALQMALELLAVATFASPELQRQRSVVIDAGLKALATQPQQEPVAWANPNDLQNFDMKVRANGGPLHTVPLYTSPPVKIN